MTEQEHSRNYQEVKYNALDMLAAFRHGREYKTLGTNKDFDPRTVPIENVPFWEWMYLRYNK